MYHVEVAENIRPSTFESIKNFKSIVAGLEIKKISNSNAGSGNHIEEYDLNENRQTYENILDIKISKYGYSKLKNHYFDGDYVINGSKENLKKFDDSIGKIKGFSIGKIDKDLYISSISDTGFTGAYYIAAFLITFLFSIICVAKNIFYRSISFFVYKLMGYDIFGVIKDIVISRLKENLLFLGFTVILMTAYLKLIKNANNLEIIMLNTKVILLLLVLSLFALFLAITKFRFCNQSFRSTIKKYTYINLIANTFFIVISALLVVLLSAMSHNINMHMNARNEFDNLTKIVKYANVDTSKAYLEEEFDLKRYRNKHRKLWEKADEKGGIYLLPGEKYLGHVQFPDAEFTSDYIEINGNYLDEIKIVDTQGKRINPPKNDRYTITVLVPERYRNDIRLKKHIRSEHIFRVSEGMLRKTDDGSSSGEYTEYKNYDDYIEKTERVKIKTKKIRCSCFKIKRKNNIYR